MDKKIDAKQAAALIRDGMTVMVGGFFALGTPKRLIDALLEGGAKDLTIISNDAGTPDLGVGKLIAAHRVKRLIASHIGKNPLARQLMEEGQMDISLVPQGTLAERIRAAGAGLGGVLTPTGIGTEVAKGKDIVVVDGKEYLLEKPIHADAALVCGSVVDESGNIFYWGATRNFCPLMATAAKLVIAGAEEIVPIGAIAPENIVTPGIFVDYIVGGEQA